MTDVISIENWLLTSGGPSALYAYFLYLISERLGELKGLVERGLNGRNCTSKKNRPN